MEWKEILKVSVVIGIVSFVLQVISNFVWPKPTFGLAAFIVGLLGTGAILKKRLKDEWGVFVGLVITFLVVLILVVLSDTLGLYSNPF